MMTGMTRLQRLHYSGNRFARGGDRPVTRRPHLLSIETGKEIRMSTTQPCNRAARSAEPEALESLVHMTAWARQASSAGDAPPAPAPAPSKLGRLVDDFALSATAFYPGYNSFALPQDMAPAGLEPAPRRRSRALRAAGVIGGAIGGTITRLWRGYRQQRAVARTTALLAEMDDRTLRDIGLSRADISRAARHARDRVPWR
jgi:uncharacterized protein YjiS (DUF1127 family)